MNIMKVLSLTVFVALFLSVLSVLVISSNSENKVLLKKEEAREPCWFMNSDGFNTTASSVVKERQDRETFGYPSDISLTEALAIFNQEQKCISKNDNSMPDMTEDELISAISVSPDYPSQNVWKLQKQSLQYILREKKLPKGALLVNEGGVYSSTLGSSINDEIRVKGQRIYLFFDLDKNPRTSEALKQEQTFLLKKTLFGLERIN
jgi:hypothetical protein